MTDQTPILKRDLFLTEADVDDLPPFRWMIPNVLPETGIALLYGKTGEGKSFIAIDLAEAIAHGTSAWGQKFEPGNVLYVAAEGVSGVGKRFKGWRAHNGNLLPGKNLIVVPKAVDFRDAKGVSEFSERLRLNLDGQKQRLRLVVIDTLSRCFGGGDENSQAAMSAFIGNIQRDIVDRFQCLALILHHTPRANSETPRGSNVNDGAADTMLLVSKQSDGQLVTVVKQKEGEEGVSLFFRRNEVELPSHDGESETTLVMTFEERRGGGTKSKPDRKPSKRDLALHVLAGAGAPLTREEWHKAFKEAGGETGTRGGRTFTDVLKLLIRDGLVQWNGNSDPATYSTN